METTMRYMILVYSTVGPDGLTRLTRLFAAHSALIVGVIVGVAGGAGAQLCRHLRFRPVAEVAEAGASGAGCEDGGAEVEKSAEDVVVHAADFGRFAGLLPALAGEAEVEIDFLVVVDDAQSSPRCALLLAAGDVAVGYAHADALAVQQDAGRVLGIVEKQQAGGAAGGDLDVNFDGIGVAADRGGESGTVGQRTAARLQVQHALAGRKARLVELVPEGPLQAEFGAGEVVRGVGEG